MSKFDGLVDEILEFWWKTSPVSATFSGIHKYDHKLDKVERDFLEEVNKRNKEYLTRISKISKNELTNDEYIDWRLLKNSLESGIKSFEEIRHWEKNPSYYAETCLYSLFILFIREFASIEERAESFLSRLKQISRLIEDGQQNLKDSPGVFTKLAIEVIEGGQVFFKTVVPQLGEMVPKLKSKLEKANAEAGEAFENYYKFLKTKYLPKSKGEFAIGKELFNFKLDKDHMLPYDVEDVLQIGKEAKQMTEVELREVARAIDPNKTWWEIVEDIKGHYPKPSELLETYKNEMVATKKFIIEKKLVTIPVGEELEVIPTPPFDRPTIPYAAYMSPAPFEKQQKGFFYVTLVGDDLPREKQEEMLRGHSIYGIPVTALHEGYPGHHLQIVSSNRVGRKLRRLLGSSVFAEGWALYCEEMMYDEGFYSDPRTKLLKLKDQLWRACRVIIDVGLHTKSMNYTEAVNFLVNEAKLEKIHAEKEVTRYTYTPTQPLSYLIGKKQILELRKDYKKMDKEFCLKEFHDRLLSFGTIPVVLIREAMGL